METFSHLSDNKCFPDKTNKSPDLEGCAAVTDIMWGFSEKSHSTANKRHCRWSMNTSSWKWNDQTAQLWHVLAVWWLMGWIERKRFCYDLCARLLWSPFNEVLNFLWWSACLFCVTSLKVYSTLNILTYLMNMLNVTLMSKVHYNRLWTSSYI